MEQGKKTILIVEDEEDLREVYTMAMTNRGYNVVQAFNGLKALELLEKRYAEIDLILLDIVMPMMDGFEVLNKIKNDDRFEKIKVVMCTNLDNDGDRKQASEMGVIEYFVKSQHTPAELVGEINLIFSKEDSAL
jgi:CheY-like chemotaxis protein